jgi:hypothetical protein
MKGKCGNEDCRMSREERKRRREKTVESERMWGRERVRECLHFFLLLTDYRICVETDDDGYGREGILIMKCGVYFKISTGGVRRFN